LTVVRRQTRRTDLAALAALAEAHEVHRVVVGLPLNMDGSEGPRAAASREFGRVLAETLHLPVEYWDERLSTVAAERVLIEADLSRARRKQVIDQVAAAYILQGWLDAHGAHPTDEAEKES
jgi:putative Holliday junction resolvase